MEIKDQTMETAVDEDGNTYISEIDATMTDVSADGTVSVAEMTTTANPDDPTDVEGHMTVTETATDGTETVTEYVSNDDGVFKVEEDSMFENAVEAIFGVEIEDDLTQVLDADGNPVGEDGEILETDADETDFEFDDYSDAYSDGTDTAPVSVEFNLGDDGFGETTDVFNSPDTLVSDESFEPTMETVDPTFTETPTDDATFETFDENADFTEVSDADETAFTAETADVADTTFADTTETPEIDEPTYEETVAAEEANQAELDQQAHTQAATDAQTAADDFVDRGDYAAASEAREVAENEAWEAGDNSMLGAYDAQDLASAADHQDKAEEYEQQQAEHAQAGDYEAARDDASNAAYEAGYGDMEAGGADHTGQADSEYANMDNAVWHEGLAEDQLDNAEWYAEQGNADAAETALNAAEYEQETADEYGDQGEHGATGADYDPSSEVETGGSYESTYEDHSADIDTGFDASADTGYDSGMDAVDTGYDDMSVDTGFDSGVDTSMDTGYDSGIDDV